MFAWAERFIIIIMDDLHISPTIKCLLIHNFQSEIRNKISSIIVNDTLNENNTNMMVIPHGALGLPPNDNCNNS